MDPAAYFGFVVPLALLTLGLLKLAGTDAVLGVFVAAAIFGQVVPVHDKVREDFTETIINRFFINSDFSCCLARPCHLTTG